MTPPAPEVSFAERLGNTFDELRFWVIHSWRLGSLMAKGAYLVTERKRLLRDLGEIVYQRLSAGQEALTELDGRVKELERLTKKVELQEILIRNLRFGEARRRPAETGKEAL